jgi:hypothetical protein
MPTPNHPANKYTNVHVTPIQGGSGSLSGGNGTYSTFGVFSCGDFDSKDRPEIGKFYNITGTFSGTTYNFPGMKCVHSGATSDFKDPNQA